MSLDFVKILYDQNKNVPSNYQFYLNALQDIIEDGIGSQVFSLLKQQGRLGEIRQFFKEALKEKYDNGFYQNLFIKNQTNLILEMFEEKGIDVIPLKGVYFAEKYYGNIGARITSDIDLLIKMTDLNKAINTIKLLGFSMDGEQISGHFHCSLYKDLPQSSIPLVVEIHWNIAKENTANINMDDIWREARTFTTWEHIKDLSPKHSFYFICLHGWRHNLDSMKYFIDILQVLYLHRDEIDYEQLFSMAKEHRTFKRLLRTLSIVYQQFPELDQVLKLPYKKMKTLWKYHHEKGYKKYIDFIDYQFLSYDSWKHSMIELHQWIWPSKHDATLEIGSNIKGTSRFRLYLSLYKKRVSSLFKAVLHN